MRFAGVSVLVALVAGATAQNFQASCSSWSLSRDSHYLVGKCSAVDGSKHDAAVDLNSCIGNREGSLQAGGTGYSFSCRNCAVGCGATTLSCACFTSAGAQVNTTLNLATYVGNSNGALICVT